MSSTQSPPTTQQHETSLIFSPPTIRSRLVPIRVDVTSDDKSVRLIETLLIDPTCWPIPLTVPWSDALEQNVRHLAYGILSDMEVQGMGRTVRHFTGRVELYSASLQTKLQDQLRPQLLQAFAESMIGTSQAFHRPINIAIRVMIHGIWIQEDVVWDPQVPYSPLEFAKDLADEYNLSDEAVVAIAMNMVEQISGMASMDGSFDPSSASQPWVGAKTVDPKETAASMAQLVTLYKP